MGKLAAITLGWAIAWCCGVFGGLTVEEAAEVLERLPPRSNATGRAPGRICSASWGRWGPVAGPGRTRSAGERGADPITRGRARNCVLQETPDGDGC